MATKTLTLTEFLLARIAEDEAAAREASPGGWHYGTVESVAGGTLYDATRAIGDLTYEQLGDHDGRIVRRLLSVEANANGAHIARHGPARVLAECEAKRRILQACNYDGMTADYVLQCLAVPYADHTDYRDEWRA